MKTYDNINDTESGTRKSQKYWRLLIPCLGLLVLIILGALSTLNPDVSKWVAAVMAMVAVLLLSIRFTFAFFILFVISLPLEAAFVIEAGRTIRISYILLLILVASFILKSFKTGKLIPFAPTPVNTPLFTYVFLTAISLFAAMLFYTPPDIDFTQAMKYRAGSNRGLFQLALLVFFMSSYFITYYFCRNKKNIITVLKIYITVSVIISIYAIYQLTAIHFDLPFVDITNAISTSGKGYGTQYYTNSIMFRPHGTFQEPLNLGHYLLSTAPFLLALYINRKRNRPRLIRVKLLPIIIVLAALLLTKSRGAYAAFVGSVILLMLYQKKRKNIKLITLILLTMAAVNIILSSFYFSSENINKDFFRVSRTMFLASLKWARLKHSALLFSEYPILGVGLGHYGLYAASYFNSNILLNAVGVFSKVLTEAGLAGFCAFIWFFWAYFKALIKAVKTAKGTHWHPYITGLLASSAGLTAQYLISGDRITLYVWFYFGLSMAFANIINTEQSAVDIVEIQ